MKLQTKRLRLRGWFLSFYVCVIGIFTSTLTSCTGDKNNVEDDLYKNGSFSFMDEVFGMTELCITNHGLKNGIYSIEINLKDKNNNSIYLDLTSSTNDFNGRYTFGLGYRKYTNKSFIKIGNNVYPLSSGFITLYINNQTNPVEIMCKDIYGNFLGGLYNGEFNYIDESNQQPIPEDSGVGSFSYLNSTNNKITMGSLQYYGLDTVYRVKNYALFLQNKEGNYLRFLIFCRENKDICEGDYTTYDDLSYPTADTKEPDCFSRKYSIMYYGNNEYRGFGWGHVYINIIDSIYDIGINCQDDIMDVTQTGTITGHYKGKLWYYDFSSSSYLGDEGDPLPPISIK